MLTEASLVAFVGGFDMERAHAFYGDALEGRGVTFERFPEVAQNEGGVWTAPDGSLIAWFRDPDGNILSLQQPRA